MKQLLIKIPVSQSIQEVFDYIQYSAMAGDVDPTASWYSTHQFFVEFNEKVLDEEDSL